MKFRIHQAIGKSTTRAMTKLAMVILPILGGGCGAERETIEVFRQTPTFSGNEQFSGMEQANRVEPVAVTQVRANFSPNFPDRVDPFVFPEDATSEGRATDSSIQSVAQVDVLGFADLGQPRVFLRARDKTHSLLQGESIYGVEVIEIHPPAVRLRMGGLTWTASMFGKSLP